MEYTILRFGELSAQEKRAVLLEAFADVGPALVRKGMATFEGPKPFRVHQLFDTCFVARMFGPAGALDDITPPDDEVYGAVAEQLGISEGAVMALSIAHYVDPRTLYDVAREWLAAAPPSGS